MSQHGDDNDGHDDNVPFDSPQGNSQAVTSMLSSLKGRAVFVQCISAPIFTFLGLYFASRSNTIQEGHSLITIILLAEGLGQLALAFSTWRSDSVASMSAEFRGEMDRCKRWNNRTPSHILSVSVFSS